MADPDYTRMEHWRSEQEKRLGHLRSGDGGDRFDPMEARVAKLEAAVEHIQRDTTDIKTDLRGMRDLMWSNFKLTFAALIAVAIGLAGLMAKGFHWI